MPKHSKSNLSNSREVILIGNYAIDAQQSMQRYAELLHKNLTSRGIETRLLRPRPVIGKIKPGAHGISKLLGYIDKFILFPLELTLIKLKNKEAIYHICDHSNSLYIPFIGKRQVTTCHDILAIRSAHGEIPQSKLKWTGKLFQYFILKNLRKSQKIICVSTETHRQLKTIGGFEQNKIIVIKNGINFPYQVLKKANCDNIFSKSGLFEKLGKVRYIFHVGGNQWYKNRIGVIEIYFKLLETSSHAPDLVLAGKPLSEEMNTLISENKNGSRVHYVGTVDDETLNALYSKAECLLFPSLAEGFGWPIIEAMAAGCPVITSNVPPMNEIGANVASYLDPKNKDEAANLLEKFLVQLSLNRKISVEAGIKHSKHYSTESMIDATIASYHN